MHWGNSRPRAPQISGKAKHGKKVDKVASHRQFPDNDLNKHMPRLSQSWKDTKDNLFALILRSAPDARQQASLSPPEDCHTSQGQPSPPDNPSPGARRSVTKGSPQDKQAGRLRVVRKPSNGFHHLEDREKPTDSIHSMFRTKNNLHHPDSHQQFAQCDFIYDIVLIKSNNSLMRRRMLVDFETEVNVMDDEVYKRMNVRMQPYYGFAITVLGRSDVKPLGKVQATWSIYGHGKAYCTEFYVVRWDSFDVLLGKRSVRELELHRVDPGIAARLQQ
ncbi:hypothetical protein BO70DRAFT_428695 [Aspergillus heteromorphus CBS 117.55]|uniref:Uncharacterized protein n=1 Tax=Aspergillus heteromorphus CBS 117.55 TaxID=1448321 RepID=A0A317WBR0_9EURO|nr:uncharacterized protein BO70DRAFT_428695 [Aspergillus heteromorphus CBS 117.55]PWY83385.1 hypothetical protein BO70DRAFT_428695 [Aspergillus heteromorphus CBS 117.55]